MVKTNEWEEAFFWPIAVSDLCCVTKMRMRLSGQSEVRVGIFILFTQMYLTWGPSTWALASGCPLLFNAILLYVTQHRSQTSTVVRKYLLSLTGFNLKETERRAQARPTSSIFEDMNRTSGQPQVKQSLLLSIIQLAVHLKRGKNSM